MTFQYDHIRFLEHTGLSKPYLERNFLPPSYIGQDGNANLDNISSTLERLGEREQRLADDEVLKPEKVSKFDPDKPVDPLDFASKPTNPSLQTIELPLISDVWNGSEPINYASADEENEKQHAQISVGTPPQTFYIDLDTGSSLLWLQSIVDADLDPPLPGQIAYSPARSLAAIDQVRTDHAKYGDGDLVTVALYKDRVTLGKMDIPSALLGAAPTHGLKVGFQMSKANGILGLGFPTDPVNSGRRNLVQTLYDMGAVKHASFALIGPRVDPKLAEKIDKQVIMQPRGTFVIGSVDPAYYTGSIAWCPQIVATNRWIVKLDKILINGQVAFTNQQALIDTGTAYIVASPGNFDKVQRSIPGAAPIAKKNGMMFSFPSESLQSIGFVFGGREISLKSQDFGLGGIKTRDNQMCSSILKLPRWDFDSNLWVIGGIFLDNVVTIFDYNERKVGFADISEKDLAEEARTKEGLSSTPGSAAPATVKDPAVDAVKPTAAEVSGQPEPAEQRPKLVASDVNFCEVSKNDNPPSGREFSQRITFGKKPECQVAVGFASLDLGWQHVRAITFADENHYDSFRLNFNASVDTDTHGVTGKNPDSDTVLRSGKSAWLRALPDDPNIQTGRWTTGVPYDKGGKQLGPDQTGDIKFARSFSSPPKVILWLAGMDFSKAYNWRLKAEVKSVTVDGFTLSVGSWKDSILYKADVCWIAHSDVAGIQSGTFSTEEVRGAGWALESAGFSKFAKAFAKPPRLVAGLNKIEFGCGRDLTVATITTATEEGVKWSMNSRGNTHQYISACSYIAFDPDFSTVAAAVS